MTDVTLERHFKAVPETVFAYLSEPEHLSKWWGPEYVTLGEHSTDFTKLGPWYAIMHGTDGQQYKVSGQVLEVDPPKSLSYTWGWHDPEDTRGHNSIVSYHLEAHPDGGTRFILSHADLPDPETAEDHANGWASSMQNFETYLTQQGEDYA